MARIVKGDFRPMNPMSNDIQADLEAVLAGRLDELSPRQVERLEDHLNADPAAAARLAEQVPVPVARGQAPVISPRVPMSPRSGVPTSRPTERWPLPSEQAWARVWERIDAADPRATAKPGVPRLLRLWGPLGAAAACLLLASFWHVGRWTRPAPWPIEWAHSVEISDLQVLQGGTPLVLAAGNDDPISVLWVLETGG